MSDLFALFQQISKTDPVSAEPISWIVVGLGNCGEKYVNTRHNAGFLAIDAFAKRHGAKIDRAKFHALCGETRIGSQRILLVKPQTLMNASGIAVAEAASFYKIPAERILVLSDDITQTPSCLRVRQKGSAGGHNGLKDIINRLGTDRFPRIRIGIGEKPHPDYDLADWVLSEFSAADQHALQTAFPVICSGIEQIVNGDLDAAMRQCNSFRPQI